MALGGKSTGMGLERAFRTWAELAKLNEDRPGGKASYHGRRRWPPMSDRSEFLDRAFLNERDPIYQFGVLVFTVYDLPLTEVQDPPIQLRRMRIGRRTAQGDSRIAVATMVEP